MADGCALLRGTRLWNRLSEVKRRPHRSSCWRQLSRCRCTESRWGRTLLVHAQGNNPEGVVAGPHLPLGLDVAPPTRLRKTDRTGVFDFAGTGDRVKSAAGAEDARCACERTCAAVDELQVYNLACAD